MNIFSLPLQGFIHFCLNILSNQSYEPSECSILHLNSYYFCHNIAESTSGKSFVQNKIIALFLVLIYSCM